MHMLRSELLKLKNTTGLYLIVSFTLLELITIPLYLRFVPNGISITNLAILSFLSYPLLAAFVSILGIEQEKMANHYQEINSYPRKRFLWLTKLLIADLILSLPSLLSWMIINLLLNHWNNGLPLVVSSWILLVFLNHFHYFIQVILTNTSNIIIAMIEIIFIIFASNKVFLTIHWIPIVLPINSILTRDLSQSYTLPLWIVAITLSTLYLLPFKSQRE